MKPISFSLQGTSIHIEDFPDAEKLIKLSGEQGKKLADLALHDADLNFGLECLNEINSTAPKSNISRQALWRSAIIHFAKCFAQGVRAKLKGEIIFKNDPIGQDVFDYFIDLRNKNIAHDVNPFTQSLPAAILNKPDKLNKIEKIACLSLIADTLTTNNYNNLYLLITKSKEWVNHEFDTLCNSVIRDLELISYDILHALPTVSYTPPPASTIDKSRKST